MVVCLDPPIFWHREPVLLLSERPLWQNIEERLFEQRLLFDAVPDLGLRRDVVGVGAELVVEKRNSGLN
mgnify:CR=1 FL=1